jgi:hypothetical protein
LRYGNDVLFFIENNRTARSRTLIQRNNIPTHKKLPFPILANRPFI